MEPADAPPKPILVKSALYVSALSKNHLTDASKSFIASANVALFPLHQYANPT